MLEYEVYICAYLDEIVYIGRGKRGRHKHCTSGTSHVYRLNEIHFTSKQKDVDTLNIEVIEIATLEESINIENELIKFYQPKFNSVGIFDESYREKHRLRIIEGLKKSGYVPSGKKANKKLHTEIIKLNETGNFTKEEIAKKLNCGVATIYRVLKANKELKL